MPPERTASDLPLPHPERSCFDKAQSASDRSLSRQAMHVYIPEFAKLNAPRYTSYPTAAEFGSSVGAEQQFEALSQISVAEPISIYVHVPYCHQICWYCGCNTGAVGRVERLTQYIDALEAEMALVAPLVQGQAISVHFGGGSPNALGPALFAQVVHSLRAAFDISNSAEWAVELDPRDLDAAMADIIGTAGFHRASLGAQTFSHHIQAKINRVQPFQLVANGAAMLKRAGVKHLNLDLMYGLPGQTLDDIAATISSALTLQPDRVAMFGYAHVPHMLPRQRVIEADTLPSAEQRFWQSALAHDLLIEAGYEAIGFDHFARPEDSLTRAARSGGLQRNFQGFTDDPAHVLIGLGSSAISQFGNVLVQNEKHVGQYRMRVTNGRLAGARGVLVTPADRLRGELIERLLCDGSIDLAEVSRQHDRPLREVLPCLERLRAMEQHRLVKLDQWRVTLLPEGRPYARIAAAAFDSYRGGGQNRFSRAV